MQRTDPRYQNVSPDPSAISVREEFIATAIEDYNSDEEYTILGAEITVIEDLTLHEKVLDDVHQEMNVPLIHCGPWESTEEKIDAVINVTARLGAVCFG